MDAHLAELSRAIEPSELGRRLRNARLAAGLTQGDVAGDDVTAAYVSRIEDGQRRPQFGLLGRMAARLGTTLDALLSPGASPSFQETQLALDHADLTLRGGDGAAALTQLDSIEPRLDELGSDDLRRRSDSIRAAALEATGEINEAIVLLEQIRAQPVPTADWVRALISLSRCYRETGDFVRAIATGEDATGLITELGLEGLTESIQLSVTVAAAYVMRGDLDRATQICLKAINDSDAVQSPIAKASAYWNASVVESQKGATAHALELAQKALGYFELGEDLRNLTRLRGQVADMQLDVDPPDALGAMATLEVAFRELDWSASSPIDRASHLQTRARARLLLGEEDSARTDALAALALLPPEAALERGYAHSMLGHVELASGNHGRARESFLTAVQMLSASGADREAAQLWFDLGDQLKVLGETDAALDALTRAAAATGLRLPRTSDSARV